MNKGIKYDIDLILNKLVEVIKDSGLSYGDLSKMTGIPKSSIHRYANGTTKKIPIDAVRLIANAVGVSTSYIMGWDEEEKTPDEQTLTEGEKLWLDLYHQLSTETRAVLVNMANAFESLPEDRQKFLLDAIRFAVENQK
jgi:transcriptional regulator with XRE-family HTH domain